MDEAYGDQKNHEEGILFYIHMHVQKMFLTCKRTGSWAHNWNI